MPCAPNSCTHTSGTLSYSQHVVYDTLENGDPADIGLGLLAQVLRVKNASIDKVQNDIPEILSRFGFDPTMTLATDQNVGIVVDAAEQLRPILRNSSWDRRAFDNDAYVTAAIITLIIKQQISECKARKVCQTTVWKQLAFCKTEFTQVKESQAKSNQVTEVKTVNANTEQNMSTVGNDPNVLGTRLAEDNNDGQDTSTSIIQPSQAPKGHHNPISNHDLDEIQKWTHECQAQKEEVERMAKNMKDIGQHLLKVDEQCKAQENTIQNLELQVNELKNSVVELIQENQTVQVDIVDLAYAIAVLANVQGGDVLQLRREMNHLGLSQSMINRLFRDSMFQQVFLGTVPTTGNKRKRDGGEEKPNDEYEENEDEVVIKVESPDRVATFMSYTSSAK